MAIKRNTLPEGVAQAMAARLADRAVAHGAPDDAGGAADMAADPVDAVPIYGIDEMMLREDPEQALRDARRIGWRTVAPDPWADEDGVALIDSYASDGEAEQVRIVRGPTVSSFAAAGTLAEEQLEGRKANYEPRILDFGTLGMTALWMHSKRAEDRFYPLGRDKPAASDTAAVLAEALGRARLQPRRAAGNADFAAIGGLGTISTINGFDDDVGG